MHGFHFPPQSNPQERNISQSQSHAKMQISKSGWPKNTKQITEKSWNYFYNIK